MSNPSEHFECRWHASRCLLAAWCACQALLIAAGWLLDLAASMKALLVALYVAHGCWVLPRHLTLRSRHAITGLRRHAGGWQLWSEAQGWQAVQLRPDSLALPALIVLRFRRPGQWFTRGLCIAADSMDPQLHRRLRVRLKFSRRGWAAAG